MAENDEIQTVKENLIVILKCDTHGSVSDASHPRIEKVKWGETLKRIITTDCKEVVFKLESPPTTASSSDCCAGMSFAAPVNRTSGLHLHIYIKARCSGGVQLQFNVGEGEHASQFRPPAVAL